VQDEMILREMVEAGAPQKRRTRSTHRVARASFGLVPSVAADAQVTTSERIAPSLLPREP